MNVKPLTDKLVKFNYIGMPCTSKEFDDLKSGKSIALPKEVALEMQSMGLVTTIDKKKGDK